MVLLLLFGPLTVTFAAGLLHRYPLNGRLLLFLTPILLLFVAEGVVAICDRLRLFSPALGMLLIGLFLAKPVWDATSLLIHPRKPDDIKSAIEYIKARQQAGDILYVYYGAKYQVEYYAQRFGLQSDRLRIGSDCGDDSDCFGVDLDGLRGEPRVWILLSHILIHGDADEGATLVRKADNIGTQLGAYRANGTRAYLYDLSHTRAGMSLTRWSLIPCNAGTLPRVSRTQAR
jgi:hypothetical protein